MISKTATTFEIFERWLQRLSKIFIASFGETWATNFSVYLILASNMMLFLGFQEADV